MSDPSLFFDPGDPRFVTDPYPLYARMREENPVHRSPIGFRVFTRHADCQAILRDKRVSSNAQNADLDRLRPDALRSFQTVESGDMEAMAEMAPFLFKDPPDHTRLRGLVAKAFTPRVVEGLRPLMEEVTGRLVDEALDAGEVDLVEAFAYPLPMLVISEMLGIPVADRQMFKEWSDVLARGLDPEFLLPPEFVERRLASLFAFVVYFSGLVEERRKNPGDDLISLLVQVEEQGDTLSHAELLSTLVLLLVAGHETTVNLLSGGARALVENPAELEKLRASAGDLAAVRHAVEELMRFVSPVQWTGRTVVEDIEVGDTVLERGEFALLLIGSANRDPAAFPDPEVLNLSRPEVNHLGFGFGIHHCLGAPLARLEAQVALPVLFQRARKIELLEEVPDYKENIVLRGLATLRVRMVA